MRIMRYLVFCGFAVLVLARPVVTKAEDSCFGAPDSCSDYPGGGEVDCFFGTTSNGISETQCMAMAEDDCASVPAYWGASDGPGYWCEPDGDAWDEYCSVFCPRQ